jgi:hypothetical protein
MNVVSMAQSSNTRLMRDTDGIFEPKRVCSGRLTACNLKIILNNSLFDNIDIVYGWIICLNGQLKTKIRI